MECTTQPQEAHAQNNSPPAANNHQTEKLGSVAGSNSTVRDKLSTPCRSRCGGNGAPWTILRHADSMLCPGAVRILVGTIAGSTRRARQRRKSLGKHADRFADQFPLHICSKKSLFFRPSRGPSIRSRSMACASECTACPPARVFAGDRRARHRAVALRSTAVEAEMCDSMQCRMKHSIRQFLHDRPPSSPGRVHPAGSPSERGRRWSCFRPSSLIFAKSRFATMKFISTQGCRPLASRCRVSITSSTQTRSSAVSSV